MYMTQEEEKRNQRHFNIQCVHLLMVLMLNALIVLGLSFTQRGQKTTEEELVNILGNIRTVTIAILATQLFLITLSICSPRAAVMLFIVNLARLCLLLFSFKPIVELLLAVQNDELEGSEEKIGEMSPEDDVILALSASVLLVIVTSASLVYIPWYECKRKKYEEEKKQYIQHIAI
eukprot:snap_masked-scaffold_5-processed-gene-20.76-mRNA-1 protein AED:1.00 eAED:1.00 QI:0/-1/0/0/-1/1/1/0/175